MSTDLFAGQSPPKPSAPVDLLSKGGETTQPKDLLADHPDKGSTFQPIKDWWDYTKKNFESGKEMVTDPTPTNFAPASYIAAKGGLPDSHKEPTTAPSRVLGALSMATAPIGGVPHALISKPLERAAGVPSEYTDLLMAFTPVGIGGAAGAVGRVAKAAVPEKVMSALAPEKIESAAIRLKNGQTLTGADHDAIKAAKPPGVKINKSADKGFVTSTGRFVDRKEAATIATKAKQVVGDIAPEGLHAHNIAPESGYSKLVKGIESVFSPTTMSKDSRATEAIIRENRGLAERETEMARAQTEQFAKKVNQLPVAEQRNFVNVIQNIPGAKITDPELAKAVVPIQKIYKDVRQQLEALPEGDKMGFVEHYFPQMWKNPQAAQGLVREWAVSKAGSGRNLKQRSILTQEDGLKRGLEPAIENPLERTMQYVGNMQNYIALKKTQARMSTIGERKFFPQGKQPAGWVELKGPGNRTPHNVAYAPEDAARVYNNYYSAGWTGRTGDLYRAARAAVNGGTQLVLGLSGYHYRLIANEATAAAFSKGLDRIQQGAGRAALKSLGEGTPYAGAVSKRFRGKHVEDQYIGRKMHGLDNKVIDYLTRAGGRMTGIDKSMRSSESGNYWDAWKRGTLKKDFGVFKIGKLMDTVAYPLFVKTIPYIKNSVNYEGLADWMRFHPGASEPEILQAARDIVDSTDNRFGEMIQDNLFWDKKFKQSLQLIMLSTGWAVGTAREVAGGTKDLAKAIAEGKEMSPRARYIIGLPVAHMLNASVYQYLKTGSLPNQPQDLIYPKTGGTSPYQGTPERSVQPSQLKDIIGYQKHPLNEIGGKLAPVWRAAIEMATNSYWRGDPISYEYMSKAPGFIRGYAEYMLQAFSPISVAGAMKKPLTGSNIGRIESVMGSRPASMEAENPEAYRAMMKKIEMAREKRGIRHESVDESRRK